MKFFSDLFSNNNQTNAKIPAIMPQGAIDQINQGIIPNMRTNKIILTQDETCHFAERAILITEKTKKRIEGRSKGMSIRLCKGVTYRTGKHNGIPVEEVIVEKNKGLIYVTNKRIIFISDKNAFDKKYKYLSACIPYADGIKLQFGNNTFTLNVPDGNALSKVICMINNL